MSPIPREGVVCGRSKDHDNGSTEKKVTDLFMGASVVENRSVTFSVTFSWRGFDGAHVLGAIAELFELLTPDASEDGPLRVLRVLQKRLKYGLPAGAPILLYEAGFSDRPLALDLAGVVPEITSSNRMREAMRQERQAQEALLGGYPRYFTQVFHGVVGG
jgi:hypothetical protein